MTWLYLIDYCINDQLPWFTQSTERCLSHERSAVGSVYVLDKHQPPLSLLPCHISELPLVRHDYSAETHTASVCPSTCCKLLHNVLRVPVIRRVKHLTPALMK